MRIQLCVCQEILSTPLCINNKVQRIKLQNMKPILQLPLVIATGFVIALLSASYASSIFSIPGFSLKPGESFTVKVNITNPEEFAFGKLKNLGDQQDITNIFLQYIKEEGLINVTDYDGRVKFIGNASLGQAWFRFENVTSNDTGIYSVLYKRVNSADLFTTTFQVNVTGGPKSSNVQGTGTNLFCKATSLSLDLVMLAITAVALFIVH